VSTETTTARHRASVEGQLIDPIDLTGRHQSTQEKMRWFDVAHLPDGLPKEVAAEFSGMAWWLVSKLEDGPQLVIGLQHLIEAKDAAVRQALSDAGIVE
jgi:hypothetical protein